MGWPLAVARGWAFPRARSTAAPAPRDPAPPIAPTRSRGGPMTPCPGRAAVRSPARARTGLGPELSTSPRVPRVLFAVRRSPPPPSTNWRRDHRRTTPTPTPGIPPVSGAGDRAWAPGSGNAVAAGAFSPPRCSHRHRRREAPPRAVPGLRTRGGRRGRTRQSPGATRHRPGGPNPPARRGGATSRLTTARPTPAVGPRCIDACSAPRPWPRERVGQLFVGRIPGRVRLLTVNTCGANPGTVVHEAIRAPR